MLSSPLLDQLNSALNQWQWLYVISILVAIVSTFSIIIFNFHLTNSKHGHRISNYFYVVASLLSVLSTIAIIVKTKAIGSEQTRLTTQHEKDQDERELKDRLAISQVAANNLELQDQLSGVSTRQNSVEQAAASAHRRILNQVQVSNALKAFNSTVGLTFTINAADFESVRFETQLQDILTVAKVPYVRSNVMGLAQDDPLERPGIHISNDGRPASVAFTDALVKALAPSHLNVTTNPRFRDDVIPNFPLLGNPSDVSKLSGYVWMDIGPATN